jgi:hypothetical protein
MNRKENHENWECECIIVGVGIKEIKYTKNNKGGGEE